MNGSEAPSYRGVPPIVDEIRTRRILFSLDVWMLHAVTPSSMLFGRLGGAPTARFQTRDRAFRKP